MESASVSGAADSGTDSAPAPDGIGATLAALALAAPGDESNSTGDGGDGSAQSPTNGSGDTRSRSSSFKRPRLSWKGLGKKSTGKVNLFGRVQPTNERTVSRPPPAAARTRACHLCTLSYTYLPPPPTPSTPARLQRRPRTAARGTAGGKTIRSAAISP